MCPTVRRRGRSDAVGRRGRCGQRTQARGQRLGAVGAGRDRRVGHAGPGASALDPRLFLQAIDGGAMDAPYVKLKGTAMIESQYDVAFSVDGARQGRRSDPGGGAVGGRRHGLRRGGPGSASRRPQPRVTATWTWPRSSWPTGEPRVSACAEAPAARRRPGARRSASDGWLMTWPPTTVVVEPPPSRLRPSTHAERPGDSPVSVMLRPRLAVLRPSAVARMVRPRASTPAKVRGFRSALKP